MDEPHFFPMFVRQYLSPGHSTSGDDDEDNDSGIDTLSDTNVSPRRARTSLEYDPMETLIEKLRMDDVNPHGLGIDHRGNAPGEDMYNIPGGKVKSHYPPMEPEFETPGKAQEVNPEADKPIGKIQSDGFPVTPRGKVQKSTKKQKRLSVIHEVAPHEHPSPEKRVARTRIYKSLMKRIPGLSNYKMLRLRAEGRIPKWTHGKQPRSKKSSSFEETVA